MGTDQASVYIVGLGRPNIISRGDPLFNRSEPPTISELDSVFRTRAVDLAVRACKKAIAEWKGKVSQITHTVAATGTNAGSPGYDLLVNERLGILPEAQRMLLSGIGCAGGLATIRTAATIANDATLRGRPACVLGFTCDVTSTNIRCDLKMISENPEEIRASMALFSDASAAFVICNSLGLKVNKNAVYTVLDWETSVIPGTQSDENCLVDPLVRSETDLDEAEMVSARLEGLSFSTVDLLPMSHGMKSVSQFIEAEIEMSDGLRYVGNWMEPRVEPFDSTSAAQLALNEDENCAAVIKSLGDVEAKRMRLLQFPDIQAVSISQPWLVPGLICN
ncbi:chalcone synthase B [Fusarium denticulatum]|uniref:Chalcone synthase B n=1 Tax=Fusarium denticulatum TaxID=48507 RepID=A0A8H5U7I5_9HYPO|nr:chalcone synthase B [Fusarium denticulatum]